MLQSKLFGKTIKEIPKDEVSINAKLLIRAGFIEKISAGIYNFLPLGLMTLRKIENIIREEMNSIGGQEILMPALIPKDFWLRTNRWQTFDALFKLIGKNRKEYALGATHEEIVTPLAKRDVFSYKDLPLYLYQIQTKFRNETRVKSGLLRGREFGMKDLYSFHQNEEDLNKYYEKVINTYFKILKRVNLDDITYLTFARGGSFSKYSHEFQTVCETGEDTIYLCQKCRIAINKELIEEQKECPQCGNRYLTEKKAIEVANIFKLGARFSKSFNLQYSDQKGKIREVIMGCYGLGPTRLMGAIVEIHHDNKGIIWPKSITPFKVHLLLLSKNKRAKKQAEKTYQALQKKEIEVLYDNREESPGVKLKDADLIGIPTRLVVSDKTGNKIEVKDRDNEEVRFLSLKKLLQSI